MLNAQVVLFDGFDLLDAIGPYEVLCAAELFAGGSLNVTLVSAEGKRAVPSGMNGPAIAASGRLDPALPGLIIVPGASGSLDEEDADSVPAILARAANTELTRLLSQALASDDVVVATVCGGSVVLAMAGLLEGRPAVTNRLGMDVLRETGAIAVPARVVDDGNLVTGGGITSGLDVALHLVERLLGPRIAHEIEQLFEYERRGTVWRNIGVPPLVRREEAGANDSEAAEVASLASAARASSAFDGLWDVTIATPVGKLAVTLRIATDGGSIQGTAAQGDEVSEFLQPRLEGDVLCWTQRVTKPMRLQLKFRVTACGDRMTGTAKAGVLPASTLTGRRATAHE